MKDCPRLSTGMKKNINSILNNSKIVIAAHIYASGPALELEEYLRNKVCNLLFIGHHFSYSKNKTSFFRFYERGKIKKTNIFRRSFFPEILLLMIEAVLTILWTAKRRLRFNYFIGSDNYSTYLGLILKKLGIVKNVILYTIDFVPNRFSNYFLNKIYLFFDRQCLEHCDSIWNVSDEISRVRDRYIRVDPDKKVKQITVPLGVWKERIPKVEISKRKRRIVFMGHILEKQGVSEVIKAMPKILEFNPNIRFLVVGDGEYLNNLKILSKKLELSNKVIFTGYVKDHKIIEKYLVNSLIAVATYKPDKNSFTYFADPGKIKNYLAAGLPIVLTDVPAISKILVEKECGLIVRCDHEDIAEKIISLLQNKKKLSDYSQNSLKYSEEFDWNNIFGKALVDTLNETS